MKEEEVGVAEDLAVICKKSNCWNQVVSHAFWGDKEPTVTISALQEIFTSSDEDEETKEDSSD